MTPLSRGVLSRAHQKSSPVALEGWPSPCCHAREPPFSTLALQLENPVTTTDLVSLLKALPDGRKRRGSRYPQWWMLRIASLTILSIQSSLLGMERFAQRHRMILNAKGFS